MRLSRSTTTHGSDQQSAGLAQQRAGSESGRLGNHVRVGWRSPWFPVFARYRFLFFIFLIFDFYVSKTTNCPRGN
ncbi:hypothetical protein BDW42DRAFT_160168 [Aspergillus taichungensis]|uniref:Uncharacterized protein n=1 Tax=Aspergillus taichungensis TaxID=482145 RepID=A0A2J5I7I3_9EURO|nr:hypothetical protein BDW42DRAFT_160168 [Aspergillus taichungensis]